MADLMQLGAQWLADQRAADAARLVSYARGAYSVQVPATPARLAQATSNAGNDASVVDDYTQCDWIVRTADLVLNGAKTLPQSGDTISDPMTGDVWTALADATERCWRFTEDYAKAAVRVHCKQTT